MILITAPHSYCIDEDKRDCDRISKIAAEILSKELRMKAIFSTELRSTMDYNREASKDTKFQKEIDNYIETNNPKLNIDVHSFPNDPPIDFYIIVNYMNDYLTKLFDNMTNNGLDFKILQGSSKKDNQPSNFILDKMFLKGIPAFIIEFNEYLKNQRIQEICKIISLSIH
jgi:hypothetical protein